MILRVSRSGPTLALVTRISVSTSPHHHCQPVLALPTMLPHSTAQLALTPAWLNADEDGLMLIVNLQPESQVVGQQGLQELPHLFQAVSSFLSFPEQVVHRSKHNEAHSRHSQCFGRDRRSSLPQDLLGPSELTFPFSHPDFSHLEKTNAHQPERHSTNSLPVPGLQHLPPTLPGAWLPRSLINDGFILTIALQPPSTYSSDYCGSPAPSDHSYESSSQRSQDSHRSTTSGSQSGAESDTIHPRPHYSQFSLNQAPPPILPPPIHYPAYNRNHQRIGLEHMRKDVVEHVPSGRSHYRPHTATYGARTMPPHDQNSSRYDSPPHHLSPPSMGEDFPPLTTCGTHHQSSRNTVQPIMYQLLPPAHQIPRMPYYQTPLHEIPDPGNNLCKLLGLLDRNQPINLDVLDDPPVGKKPNYPYPTLIKLAIYGSPRKRLTLQEIYQALKGRFAQFKNSTGAAWKVCLAPVFVHLVTIRITTDITDAF